MSEIDPRDEWFHPVGEDAAWSESYYFNLVDPTTKVGAFSRMGFRPRDGWADALHAVYLPDGAVAFTYGRRTDITSAVIDAMGDSDPAVANLRFGRGEPFGSWTLEYRGEAAVMADPLVMFAATRDRPEGWSVEEHLDMEITFEMLSPPHYARGGAQGHFEQTCRGRGQVRLGDRSWNVDGFGVRDKSWGPRTWQAASGSAAKAASSDSGPQGCFLNWYSMNFGSDLALGGACGRTEDGSMRGKGWIWREGETLEMNDVHITTDFDPDDPLVHRSVRLTGTDERGRGVVVDGEVMTICPTKIPRRDGVTFVNEGLARFRLDGREGFGIAEHWHAVAR